ncbi:glycosyltransferase family 2 protein [Streptomyces sp. KAU_LT]|uniref:glycosyltransferase family 2 protein n=1 Tax=Streptomyces sp. KAU_LT TaxID=3046669 RepID=UPI0024B7BAAD|nr:glycosyltransferase family 2 protein [Streptomyces sp. KAU_LT]MDI9829950.1 glycosyltransferase family 2 protein [Streptomyces sp. KAU_LT]
MNTTPSLSVVVCAYTLDRWDDIRAALASLGSQRRPPDEIVLVIDHCPVLHRRATERLTTARVVANRERRGLSGARNTGVRAAVSDVVAFLDDDAVAEPSWTERLLSRYDDPRVAGVGGLVVPWWQSGRPAWFPPEFDWVVGCSYRGLPEEPAPVRNFIGANMSFRRERLLAAGGFRTDLGRVGTRPLGCEETELCLRITARDPGAVLLYDPTAAVRHKVPARRASWSYYRSRCYAEGLSKAVVARQSAGVTALSSERAYLRSTIPRAVRHALRPGRPAPARTVAALSLGVGATAAGYAVGSVRAPLVR